MESRMKRSIASFVLLRKCVYSKKRNDPICHDRYSCHVILLRSRRDPLHSQCIANTMTTRGTISCDLRKVIPTAIHLYKQGGWNSSTLSVVWWRDGSWPRYDRVHLVGRTVNDEQLSWVFLLPVLIACSHNSLSSTDHLQFA